MSIITPILAALLAVSFPFRGTIRYDGGGIIPGLTAATVDFRLYRDVDAAAALWGRRCTVAVQTNGMYVIEVSDAMGSEIPPGAGIELQYESLEAALATVGTSPFYAGVTIAGRSVELKPRTRIMPVPAALVAADVDRAAAKFVLTNALNVSKGVSVEGRLKVASSVSALQVAGTGSLRIGGDVTVSNAVVGRAGLRIAGKTAVTGRLQAPRLAVDTLSAQTASVASVSADVAEIGTSAQIANATPKGMIIMWYGSVNEIPQDWALCDGRALAGGGTAPDLRNLFVVGASKDPAIEQRTYKVGDRGGAEAVALTVREMPSHSHKFGDYQLGYSGYDNKDGSEYFTFEHRTEINRKTSSVGNGKSHSNLPRYCALYYLIKER